MFHWKTRAVATASAPATGPDRAACQMFIIFGSPRSGTTFLAAGLNAHSEIAIPDETDFMVPVLFVFDRVKDESAGKQIIKQVIVSGERFGRSLGAYLSAAEICGIVDASEYEPGAIFGNIYAALAQKGGGRMGGDKSPNDLLHIRLFHKTKVLENIKVVHIVRDVRDVVLSLQKTGWVEGIEKFFPREWNYTNLYLYDFMKHKEEAYILLKYEDLITDYAKAMKRVTDFLGVPLEARMLDRKEVGKTSGYGKFHRNIKKPPMANNSEKWKRELDGESLRLCEIQAREAMEVFGYSRCDTSNSIDEKEDKIDSMKASKA